MDHLHISTEVSIAGYETPVMIKSAYVVDTGSVEYLQSFLYSFFTDHPSRRLVFILLPC